MVKRKSVNKYDLSGEFGVGYASNTGNEFYFDLEDFDKIKGYLWRENIDREYGYMITKHPEKESTIRMHRVVMNATEKMDIDHVNHNPRDNRKNNLREVTHQQNMMNTRTQSNNTSGVKGVTYISKSDTWRAQLRVHGKYKLEKIFKTKEEAIKARAEAEKRYFGEYSYAK